MKPWIAQMVRETIPATSIKDPIGWMGRNVRLPGSARSERYDPTITPWTREPAEMATSGKARTVTFIKPVQSGGSAAGEAALCYWLANESSGDIQYNWENDDKARDRWDKRIEKILKACPAVMNRAPSLDKQTGRWKRGMVIFPHCNLTVQGVWQPDNLDSDTIRFEINEEVHNWEPGRLAKAYNRTSAVWNAVIFNISNAGKQGDQLHRAFLDGTQQHWEVKCPGCGQFHVMREEWDDRKPELGGLRYDADGCRLGFGEYDYNKLAPTIYYQFPCGHKIKDDRTIRKQMSQNGRYSAPRNVGADLRDRSYILEAISVDNFPFLEIIKKKHAALRALRGGDPEPWWRYLQEQACRFIDPGEDRPRAGIVTVNTLLKKNRQGLPNRVARFGALDKQRGRKHKGEMPHWWGVIRDVDQDGNSLLVFEGKLLTDKDAAQTMSEHLVKPSCVVCDSGDGESTTQVYNFCLEYGFNAIKGSPNAFFSHGPDGKKIFAPEEPLHQMLNLPATRQNPADEPFFWFYSKAGIRERLHWLRFGGEIKWEVPGDVSEDYKEHLEAEEYIERRHPRTNELMGEWVQLKNRNDLFVCECYIAMLMEMAGLIGAGTIHTPISLAE